jgi:hypothetical protein
VETHPEAALEASCVLTQAKEAHAKYCRLATPTWEHVAEIASHALRLAKLDVIYRAGQVGSDLLTADPLDVEDLLGLLRVVPFDSSMSICLCDSVWLNPTFGRFSSGIGGADADLVAGTLLIDIKTTIKPDPRSYLDQLLGYTILAEAYRSTEAPGFPFVGSVGIYLARQGALVTTPMEPVRRHPDFEGVKAALLSHCHPAPLTIEAERASKEPVDRSARLEERRKSV